VAMLPADLQAAYDALDPVQQALCDWLAADLVAAVLRERGAAAAPPADRSTATTSDPATVPDQTTHPA
jgi:hypothetical protein